MRLPLPQSTETLALLAYLAVSGRAQRRAELSELLRDEGELSSSLAQIRALVDDEGASRIVDDGASVRFEPRGARVDVLAIHSALRQGASALPTDDLLLLADELRGEFLGGVELADRRQLHDWCVSVREDMRRLRTQILQTLVERLADRPEEALPFARALAEVNPGDEAAHAALVRVLTASGRHDEAEQHFGSARRMLEELRAPRTGALLEAWLGARKPAARAAEAAPPATQTTSAPKPTPARSASPRTHYAKSGSVHLAYQVVGEGPDLVLVPGWISHVEHMWELPLFADFLARLTSFSRVILFDRRGTGMSDPVPDLPTLEQRMEDVRAVMDATGAERPVLFGISEGGPMSMLFAATYPERTSGLILYGTFAQGLRDIDHPWRPTRDQFDRSLRIIDERWGTGAFSAFLSRSIADDPAQLEAWGRFERMAVSPGGARKLLQMAIDNDVRHVLPAIHTPTLVLARSGDRITPVEGHRYIAERIPGARLVELVGNDHFPWTEDAQSILEQVEGFVGGIEPSQEPDRVLATVLFTDIVDSTGEIARRGDRAGAELLRQHHAAVRTELQRHRGVEVQTAGDGVLATFDGPARGIRCARAIVEAVRALGLEVRAGLHTGECELIDKQVAGLAVHIGARVAAKAGPGEVLVSRTVKDLVAGSGIEFDARGEHELKGVPGRWDLFAVTSA